MAFRKAQAAMEFLMTYGWALLVVLIVIGVLMYSGFVDTSNLLPEKCTLSISVKCIDYSVKTDSINLHLENVAGKVMIVRNIQVTSEALDGPSDSGPGTCELKSEHKGKLLKKSEKFVFILDAVHSEADSSEEDSPSPCIHRETAEGKKRYNIELIYSWKDNYNHRSNEASGVPITHRIKGELLANPPE